MDAGELIGTIRHTSGISGGFRQLRIYVSAVMADFETFVMRPKEDTARDKLIPRKLVRQSRGDTKDRGGRHLLSLGSLSADSFH